MSLDTLSSRAPSLPMPTTQSSRACRPRCAARRSAGRGRPGLRVARARARPRPAGSSRAVTSARRRLLAVEHRQPLHHQLAHDAQRAHDGRAVGLERGDQRRDDARSRAGRAAAVQLVGVAPAHALHEAAVRGLALAARERKRRASGAFTAARVAAARRVLRKVHGKPSGNNDPLPPGIGACLAHLHCGLGRCHPVPNFS